MQDTQKINFSELAKNRVKVNAFECHWQMTNKEYLYANVRQYCYENGVEFDMMPVTFCVNFAKPAVVVRDAFVDFLKYFLENHPKRAQLKIKGNFHILR